MAAAETLQPAERTRQRGYPAANRRYNFLMAAAVLFFIFGLFLDGWAHNHGRVDDSFFTVWHGVMYGAYGIVGLLLVVGQFYYVNRGYAWTRALPRGYFPALIGVLLFGIAGGADMFWHEAFGIEENIEALLSPSHLTLAVAAFLFVSGPFMQAWSWRESAGWRDLLPMILSAAAILSLMTFFTQFSSPATQMRALIGVRPAQTHFDDLRGITSGLIFGAQITGLLLVMLRRWRLPFGTMTLLLTINAALMIWLMVRGNADFLYGLPAFIAGGLLLDGLIWWLKPSAANRPALRLIAALTPFLLVLIFMGGLHLQGMEMIQRGLWWKTHMWLGVPVLSGIAGLLLSFVAVPPALPEEVQ